MDFGMMLPLDDIRWTELHAEGESAAYVTQWLRKLLKQPNDLNLFVQSRWMLCSDEVTWSASFAAAPYLVECAQRAELAARVEYVCFLGSLAMYQSLLAAAEPSTK